MITESIESERLGKLISDKKAYMAKLTNDVAKKHLQQEIMFLENTILPVVLETTTIVFSEFARYSIRCIDAAIKHNCNSVIFYFPLKTDYCEAPVIGVVNPKQNLPLGNPGAIRVYCNELEFINMDGTKTSVEPVNLDIIPLM